MADILLMILMFITFTLRFSGGIVYLLMLNTLFISAIVVEQRKNKELRYKKYFIIHIIIYLLTLINYSLLSSYFHIEKYIFIVAILELLDITYKKVKLKKKDKKKTVV